MSLTDAIIRAWTKDTSAEPELWSSEYPGIGQADVTAFYVSQELEEGYEIQHTLAITNQGNVLDHYLFTRPDGRKVTDFIMETYPPNTTLRSNPTTADINKLVRKEGFTERYRTFKSQVDAYLNK